MIAPSGVDQFQILMTSQKDKNLSPENKTNLIPIPLKNAKLDERLTLEKQLYDAIEKQEFERAAEIRDEIKGKKKEAD